MLRIVKLKRPQTLSTLVATGHDACLHIHEMMLQAAVPERLRLWISAFRTPAAWALASDEACIHISECSLSTGFRLGWVVYSNNLVDDFSHCLAISMKFWCWSTHEMTKEVVSQSNLWYELGIGHMRSMCLITISLNHVQMQHDWIKNTVSVTFATDLTCDCSVGTGWKSHLPLAIE